MGVINDGSLARRSGELVRRRQVAFVFCTACASYLIVQAHGLTLVPL